MVKSKGWAARQKGFFTHVIVSITIFHRHCYFSKRTKLAKIPVIDVLVISETL